MDRATQRKLYKRSLFFSTSLLMVGILLRILHLPAAYLVLGAAYLLGLGYILIGLFQVLKSMYWSVVEKFLWTLGLLVLPFLVGFVYYHIVVKPNEKV